MIVELIGPAGSGKTTTACLAGRMLQEKGVDVLDVAELERLESEIGPRSIRKADFFAGTRLVVGMFCRCPDIAIPILLLSLIYGPEKSTGSRRRRRRRARKALAHVRMALALRKTASNRLVLLDEGFTQLLWTLLIDGPGLRAAWLIRFVLRRYHAAIGQMGIRLVIDDATVTERVFARAWTGRFSKDSTGAQRRSFGRWLDFHRALVDLVPGTLTRTSMPMTGSQDDTAARLVAAVETIRRSANAQASGQLLGGELASTKEMLG